MTDLWKSPSDSLQQWWDAIEDRAYANKFGNAASEAVFAKYPRWLRWRRKVKREAYRAYVAAVNEALQRMRVSSRRSA